MGSRIPKSASDIKVWSLVLNDALRNCARNENILIEANGNNPPTVKLGSKFWVHNTDTYLTPASPPTGNNAYQANTTINYYMPYAIFEQADRTFAWSSGNFPAKSNSTVYYLYCASSEDIDSTSRGKGVYGASTNAPTWDEDKVGWYSSDGKVLARFFVDGSGNVVDGSICEYNYNLVAETYTTTAVAPAMSGLNIRRDNNYYNIVAIYSINANAGIYQYVNGDTTATNYYSAIGPANAAGAYADNPLIYTTGGVTINGKVSQFQNIYFSSNKYNAIAHNSTNKSGGTAGNPALMPNMVGDDEVVTRTNITSLSWALTAGSWVAGSDIRVYRI